MNEVHLALLMTVFYGTNKLTYCTFLITEAVMSVSHARYCYVNTWNTTTNSCPTSVSNAEKT